MTGVKIVSGILRQFWYEMKFSCTSRQKDVLSLKLPTKILMQLQFLCYTELDKTVNVKNLECFQHLYLFFVHLLNFRLLSVVYEKGSMVGTTIDNQEILFLIQHESYDNSWLNNYLIRLNFMGRLLFLPEIYILDYFSKEYWKFVAIFQVSYRILCILFQIENGFNIGPDFCPLGRGFSVERQIVKLVLIFDVPDRPCILSEFVSLHSSVFPGKYWNGTSY